MHENLHSCALCFRVLRRHGYHVSTDIFESFKDSNGNFTTSLAADVEGMLSLYEASHLALDGESTLDKAREFASFHLKNMLGKMDMRSAMRVSRALELPSHHRMQRLEARWNIEMYDKQNKANQLLHKLATLDFNLVQKVHQRDLQDASRWWRQVGLANKLSFARDRLMESFFWTVGMISEPQFSKCRVGLTKVVKLITVLDDIYDVYGSADELELLINAVDKWDVNAVNDLPDYMKLFFFALYNTVNDMAYDTLKEQDQVIISQLKKVWADLCKAFLREAEWRYKKEIPRFDEYLDHGWTSSSGVVFLTHTYFLTTQNITHEAIKALNDGHGLLRSPSTVFRLANDLSSSKWADLCKAFLREAEWRYKKEIPRFDEYLDHGWTSSSGVVLLTHAYFLTTQNITHEDIKALNDGHGLLRSPSTVFRLANDLSSSKDDVGRGETAKAVLCYMHETGASDEVACAYIGKLIDQNWKMINKENTYNSALFGKCFIQTAQNLAA
ncbi:UNVERIFIED_CONTAM: Isoprene synthase, chloroplastic [Sesamum angustifolium]|uniref:Isoprene synthase, chloroplastic n=1 Tax=Sesamum angustifolium TaxID=2727405 RepID=A0AAW2QTC6_9LAMI